MKRGFPFSISILALMTLIVVPLAAGLLAMGWRTASSLERDNVELRVASLESAVANWLTAGLRTITAVGLTLVQGPSFAIGAGDVFDGERRRQLAILLGHYPALAAAYVGYDDGTFFYAGRSDLLGPERRSALGAPDGPAVLVRTIRGADGERRESWSFLSLGGGRTEERDRPADFDPRMRPWYRAALAAKAPVVTEPYASSLSGVIGVSVAAPMSDGRGVISFDFSLTTLSRLVSNYKVSANSIVVLATQAGNVLAESAPCPSSDRACFAEGTAVRDILRRETAGSPGQPPRHDKREVEVAGRRYVLLVKPIPSVMGEHFTSGVAVPLAEISVNSQTLIREAGIAGSAAVALAILAALMVSVMLSRSLARIALKTERIRDLDFSDRVPVASRIREVLRLSRAVERMREGLEVFGRYVSKDLVRQIMQSPESAGVGGVRRDLTVMFTDIEGFSRLSEGMPPELLTSRLSRYFEALGAPIVANRGTIDKYIGDSIMAFWNAPVLDGDHVANACRAALGAAAAGRALADKWRARGRPGFRTRFGLHTGPAVVGNVGARDRINYTLVGAVANQASRLEGLNKVYGTEILASGEVARQTADLFVWRHVDRIVAAGTTEVLDIYEPLSAGTESPSDAAFLDRWNFGRAAYHEQRFAEAILHFECAVALRANDRPCRIFIERSRALARNGVAADWDGVWRHDQK
jgi:adenylate cyclase